MRCSSSLVRGRGRSPDRTSSSTAVWSRTNLCRPKDRDEEVGVFGERSQIPGGQQQVGGEPSLGRIVKKVGEVVAATGAEADHRSTLARQVGTQSTQYLHAGARGKKRHDMAGGQNHVERLGDAPGRQVELGEVSDEPARTGMILLGRLDKHRVNVDTDRVV